MWAMAQSSHPPISPVAAFTSSTRPECCFSMSSDITSSGGQSAVFHIRHAPPQCFTIAPSSMTKLMERSASSCFTSWRVRMRPSKNQKRQELSCTTSMVCRGPSVLNTFLQVSASMLRYMCALFGIVNISYTIFGSLGAAASSSTVQQPRASAWAYTRERGTHFISGAAVLNHDPNIFTVQECVCVCVCVCVAKSPSWEQRKANIASAAGGNLTNLTRTARTPGAAGKCAAISASQIASAE
mmetsp:Transcript_36205/g.102349  ORF Transcript_36205/g.102349 Transcript_36205/m.102349 type:complete len:241 (-) Transcript_36205:151-873(-)